jgi:ubiquinol-cytochrome c reductase subunit 7
MLKTWGDALWKRASTAYRARVGKELAAHGLMYEDAMIETEDVKLALKRLPEHLLVAREQRLKRAMVLSSQQKTLPPEVATAFDPFESYLTPYLETIAKEKKELLLTK